MCNYETSLEIVHLLPVTLQVKLNDTISQAIGEENSMETAWEFRQQFDAILDYQPPSTRLSASSENEYKLQTELSIPVVVPPQQRSSSCEKTPPAEIISLSKENLPEAKQLIRAAIDIGSKAYNAGDIDHCATVYQEAALEIVGMLPNALQGKLNDIISQAIGGESNSKERAWAFRRQFDFILEYQLPFTPISAYSDNEYDLDPFKKILPPEPLVVNDNVMGGVSVGRWDVNRKTFQGCTSLANNGGFASLRWRPYAVQNWSYAEGIYLKGVRHGLDPTQTFRLLVKDALCDQIRLTNFKATFANPSSSKDDYDDDNAIIYIPFSAFDQMERMGRPFEDSPPLNRGAVTELGLMAIQPTVVGEFSVSIPEWGLYVRKSQK